MSILLDSLRKSEAQRKVREAPSIHSGHDYERRPGAVRWPAMLMVGIAAVAIAWLGWRQYADPARQATDAQSAALSQSAAREPGSTGESAGSESSDSQQPDTGPRTPVEQLSRPEPGPNPVESGETGEADVVETPAERIAAFSPGDEHSMDQADAGGEPATPIAAPEHPDERIADERARARAEAPERRMSSGTVSTPEPEFMSYWQLPQSWRNEMPELKITVLVYAEASEDRFLLVNGERLREGDALEGGVVLEQIRRDGAVFSYRSRQFLVKS